MLHDAPGAYIEAQRIHEQRVEQAERMMKIRQLGVESGPRVAVAATLRWLADRVDSAPSPSSTMVQQSR